MKNNLIKLTFGDIVIECTKEEAVEILQGARTPSGHYYSSSLDKLVKIEEMHSTHIKNALNKAVIKYFQNLSENKKTISDKEYVEKFEKFTEDTLLTELFTEMKKRVEANQ